MLNNLYSFLIRANLSEADYLSYLKVAAYDDSIRDKVENIEKKYPFQSWFANGNRIYLDFQTQEIESNPIIEAILNKYGFELFDYKAGLAYDKSKRPMRIGKVLERIISNLTDKVSDSPKKKENVGLKLSDDDKLFISDEIEHTQSALNNFKNDLARSNKDAHDLQIVISQDKHDIARMSHGRGWTSCMNIESGVNADKVFCEIKDGGLVAYLIFKEDQDIKSPIARIHIRNFSNERQSIAVPELTVYGNNLPGFQDAVSEFCKEKNEGITGSFQLSGGHYSDSFPNNVKPTGRDREYFIEPDELRWTNSERGFEEIMYESLDNAIAIAANNPPNNDKQAAMDKIVNRIESGDGNISTYNFIYVVNYVKDHDRVREMILNFVNSADPVSMMQTLLNTMSSVKQNAGAFSRHNFLIKILNEITIMCLRDKLLKNFDRLSETVLNTTAISISLAQKFEIDGAVEIAKEFFNKVLLKVDFYLNQMKKIYEIHADSKVPANHQGVRQALSKIDGLYDIISDLIRYNSNSTLPYDAMFLDYLINKLSDISTPHDVVNLVLEKFISLRSDSNFGTGALRIIDNNLGNYGIDSTNLSLLNDLIKRRAVSKDDLENTKNISRNIKRVVSTINRDLLLIIDKDSIFTNEQHRENLLNLSKYLRELFNAGRASAEQFKNFNQLFKIILNDYDEYISRMEGIHKVISGDENVLARLSTTGAGSIIMDIIGKVFG